MAAADASGTGMKVVADILPVARHTVGGVPFEIVPDLLGGVEFRGIAGEPLDMQAWVVLPQLGQVGTFVDAPLVPQKDDVAPQVME